MMNDETAQFGWRFDNSYSHLPAVFHSRVNPTPVAEPRLVLVNHSLAQSLGIDTAAFTNPEAAAYFTGNLMFTGAEPIAQAYAGHQYGNLVRLGDGRAILLGEHVTAAGQRFDIQVKGSGPTPYSRRGDGRAALGPMLREYLISEAMHSLGIPSTRSLAVVSTGEPVFREQPLPGAVLTRTAASHIRVGTFEYFAALGDTENLRVLADYTHRGDSFVPVILERFSRMLQQARLTGCAGRRHCRRQVDEPLRVCREPAHYFKRRNCVLFTNGDVVVQPRPDGALHTRGFLGVDGWTATATFERGGGWNRARCSERRADRDVR